MSFTEKQEQQQQKQQANEEAARARDEALVKVQAEQNRNAVVFPTLTCEYCGEIFREGQWLYAHQTSECAQKRAIDTKNEEWAARKRVYEIKFESVDRKESEIKRLSEDVRALRLELLEAKHTDEAYRQVDKERSVEASRKKAELQEREWYLNASDEERELHYFETTGLSEVEKHSEKVKALRAAIAAQKKKMKEKESRVTTKG